MTLLLAAAVAGCESGLGPQAELRIEKAALGRRIFFDITLSNPAGQSCASCHSPFAAFSDPSHAMVSHGANAKLFGYRNAPSLAYACYTPLLHYDALDSTWVGGLFLDGRARDLRDQAPQPIMNPLEMNGGNAIMVAARFRQTSYFDDFTKIYGAVSSNDSLIAQMSDALAEYERSPTFRPFTSKFDSYLMGRAALSVQELRGLRLFKSRAMCANCHSVEPDGASGHILFTDFTYDNLGVPRNLNNPYYRMPPTRNPRGEEFIDEGLAKTVHQTSERGKFKVPTLRNVAVTAPYFHNGIFSDVKQVVHWYNVRDSATKSGLYGEPEIPENVNRRELGNLHLSARDEDDIVAFLQTLTDGYQ